MGKVVKSDLAKEYVRTLVKALLKLASNPNTDDSVQQEVKVEWIYDNQLQVTGVSVDKKGKEHEGTTLKALLQLIEQNNPQLIAKTKAEAEKKGENTGKAKTQKQIDDYIIDKVRNSIRYLQELKLLEDLRPETQKSNSPYWKFKLVNLKYEQTKIEQHLKYIEEKLGISSSSTTEQLDSKSNLEILFGVPSLPTHHQPRPEELEPLKEKVLSKTNKTVGITATSRRVGLQGMGGIGKTVLATALGRDEDIIRAFSDGVFWITLGQTPELLSKQSLLAEYLNGDQAAFTSIESGKARLQKLFADKACLLILDDIWDSKHLKAFNSILDSRRSQMLITTRDASIISCLGAKKHELGVLSDRQALTLLAQWTGYEKNAALPSQAQEIVGECGNLPLALAMVGAMLRGKDRWEYVLYRLRNADLDKIKQQFLDYPYPDLLKAIQVSVDALEPRIKKKYFDFAIFPEDTAIPEKILQIFWEAEDLNKYDAHEVVNELVDKSLASQDENGNLRLHDLQLDYVIAIASLVRT
ncbi:NB-ARC domain-containing protein [Mastigocoleus testarum]|uniref:Uncharacterized protein n=1 Tax=Mastigocoleus testarum BC008 TaxID=371196 RepID=A0A0V7ZL76_9CYAN|nr:NB-ARC domain-containing protein [Mastigocoleus testarum]KST65418.1 hypothetical protein BC008_41515 [Mastigocoleus testarum BC008]